MNGKLFEMQICASNFGVVHCSEQHIPECSVCQSTIRSRQSWFMCVVPLAATRWHCCCSWVTGWCTGCGRWATTLTTSPSPTSQHLVTSSGPPSSRVPSTSSSSSATETPMSATEQHHAQPGGSTGTPMLLQSFVTFVIFLLLQRKMLWNDIGIYQGMWMRYYSR